MKKTTLKAVFWSVAFIIILLGACSSPPPTSPSVRSTTPISTPGVSPLVSPLVPTLVIPTPEPDKGSVTATIFNQQLNQPYADRYIYLGHISEMQSTTGGSPIPFVELDVQADPYGHTDGNGQLVISNVAPGKYALILWAPNLQQLPLVDPKTNYNIFVEVQPGKISNLGVVKVAFPE